MMDKVCGNCKQWEREKPYKWGQCWAPVPAWVDKRNSAPIFPDNKMAEECEFFENSKARGEPT